MNQNYPLECKMDERLTNLLVQNLLTNTIKNCASEKDIHIEINKDSFSISNDGDAAINHSNAYLNVSIKKVN